MGRRSSQHCVLKGADPRSEKFHRGGRPHVQIFSHIWLGLAVPKLKGYLGVPLDILIDCASFCLLNCVLAVSSIPSRKRSMSSTLGLRLDQIKSLFRISSLVKAIKDPSRIIAVADLLFFDKKMRPLSSDEILRIKNNSIRALKQISERSAILPVQVVYDAFQGEDAKECFSELEMLFNRYGSDKAAQNYHYIYSSILGRRRHDPVKILEIGLGSNNIDVPSNMGRSGKPGASLRAFRDYGSSFQVYGADVDRRILFFENRIETFFVDQTKPSTLAALAGNFAPKSFDLVIDDGLHTSEANLNFLNFALDLVKDDGIILVEDINIDDLPFWQLAAHILKDFYDCSFVACKGDWEHVFVVNRKI